MDDQFTQAVVVQPEVNLTSEFVSCHAGFDDTGQDEPLTWINRREVEMLRPEAAIEVSAVADAHQSHRVPGRVHDRNIDRYSFVGRHLTQLDLLLFQIGSRLIEVTHKVITSQCEARQSQGQTAKSEEIEKPRHGSDLPDLDVEENADTKIPRLAIAP
jgi:hypothetical protein